MTKTEYNIVSQEAFRINGLLMKNGEYMDNDKRKIVFTTLQVLFDEHEVVKKWNNLDESSEKLLIDNFLKELIIKKISKSFKFLGARGYMVWRKGKDIEPFIENLLTELLNNDKDLINKILNKQI